MDEERQGAPAHQTFQAVAGEESSAEAAHAMTAAAASSPSEHVKPAVEDVLQETQEHKLPWLALPGYGLTALPEALWFCTHVTSLSLPNSALTTLPFEIVQLENLEHLNLSGNPLAKWPKAVFYLPELTSLNLSCTGLEEVPPKVSRLENLRSLNLSFNVLGCLPRELAQLKKLGDLNLAGNPALKQVRLASWETPLILDLRGTNPETLAIFPFEHQLVVTLDKGQPFAQKIDLFGAQGRKQMANVDWTDYGFCVLPQEGPSGAFIHPVGLSVLQGREQVADPDRTPCGFFDLPQKSACCALVLSEDTFWTQPVKDWGMHVARRWLLAMLICDHTFAETAEFDALRANLVAGEAYISMTSPEKLGERWVRDVHVGGMRFSVQKPMPYEERLKLLHLVGM